MRLLLLCAVPNQMEINHQGQEEFTPKLLVYLLGGLWTWEMITGYIPREVLEKWMGWMPDLHWQLGHFLLCHLLAV